MLPHIYIHGVRNKQRSSSCYVRAVQTCLEHFRLLCLGSEKRNLNAVVKITCSHLRLKVSLPSLALSRSPIEKVALPRKDPCRKGTETGSRKLEKSSQNFGFNAPWMSRNIIYQVEGPPALPAMDQNIP